MQVEYYLYKFLDEAMKQSQTCPYLMGKNSFMTAIASVAISKKFVDPETIEAFNRK